MDHFTDTSRIMLSDVDHVRKGYLLRTFSLRLYSAPSSSDSDCSQH